MTQSIMNLLSQALTLSQQAESVVTNNLANYETPGFHPQQLKFQTALAQAWNRGQNISAVHGQMVTQSGAVRPDGSGVSMTAQMSELMKVQLLYATAAQGYTREYTEVKAAVQGQAL